MSFIKPILIFFVVFIAFIAIHEITHCVILEYYGATDYSFTLTRMSPTIVYSGQCGEICLLAHSINDIVSYNIISMLILICMMIYLK